MTSVEPATSRTYLLGKPSFTHAVPQPPVLGRATRYPSDLAASYDAATDSYRFVFSNFVPVQ